MAMDSNIARTRFFIFSSAPSFLFSGVPHPEDIRETKAKNEPAKCILFSNKLFHFETIFFIAYRLAKVNNFIA
ncbi:hypothetical protein MM59RIKEN_27620 [Pusillibacter faecalis]|uniref:Uncharacterized protein n=1 Tax=Pusillibacter faecalis TaxID=2714358 RepID=A0A810QMP0_9FIRM|nr:hypothetical protein MM59RIKEN_27620 [Pusillibacter faecalis]